MTETEMFEQSFYRPKNYFKLSSQRQWEIDDNLGILDWKGENLTKEELERFYNHYNLKNPHKINKRIYTEI